MLPQIEIPHIGKYSYCASQPVIWNRLQTTIGSFVSIGSRVIIGNGEHPLNYISTSPYLYLDRLGFKNNFTRSHNEFEQLAPVHIGNDVWIGDDVKIQNGITIGDGAVIGTSAVVTHDVPPYAIVVGIPAKILRYRFNKETIKELLEIKWWELDIELIKFMPYDDINKAIDFVKQVRSQSR